MSRADEIRQAVSAMEGRDYLVPHDIEAACESWLEVTHAARRWADWLDGPTDEDIEAAATALEATIKAHVLPPPAVGTPSSGVFFGASMQDLARAALEAVRVRKEQI